MEASGYLNRPSPLARSRAVPCTVPLALAFLQARKILSASCAGISHSPPNSTDLLASFPTAAHTYGMRKIDSAYLRT